MTVLVALVSIFACGMKRFPKFIFCSALALGLWVGTGRLDAQLSANVHSGQIGLVVAKLLEAHHYSGHRLDDAISGQLLTNYVNALDYNHLIFRAGDLEKFQKYADTLDDSLLSGNVQPAFDIYDCYSNRVEECVAMAKQFLKEPVRFDGADTIVLDRHEAPWPTDEDQTRKILRQRVKSELLEERLNKEKPEEAVAIINRRYERVLRNVREADVESVLDIYLNALSQAYDPHTQYLTASSLDNFNIDMKLSLTGIGAVLRSEDGYAKIMGIVPGGPADLDKRLKVNDRIAGVAQGDGAMVDVVDMKLNKVVELIRGEKGTTVRLKVIPTEASDSSNRQEIRLVRDEIKLTAQEAKAKVIEKNDATGKPIRLGYLEVPSFYVDIKKGPSAKSSTRDVAKLLGKLKAEKIDGLVVDLRRNSGGSLAEAISLTGLFIEEGPVVQVKDTHGKVVVQRDEDSSIAYDGPMVVLASHLSASAAEIFAAAMQDYGRAVIVGDQNTFGKGTVQQIVDLDPFVRFKKSKPASSGALKLTIQKFYRISGGSTQARGVVADIHLPSKLDVIKVGETTLSNSLGYDEVARSNFKPWGVVTPYLSELRERSERRMSINPEFKYVKEDIELAKKQLGEKSKSLNEASREAEKKANTERLEMRKKERLARKSEPLKKIELAVADDDAKTNAVAALTTKVLEEAASNGEGDMLNSTDPAQDLDFGESLEILADYISLSSVKTASATKR